MAIKACVPAWDASFASDSQPEVFLKIAIARRSFQSKIQAQSSSPKFKHKVQDQVSRTRFKSRLLKLLFIVPTLWLCEKRTKTP